jgi:hypothetical protein
LRELCRVTDHDDDLAVRRKVARTLTSFATGLPPDLQTCFLAAFGLPPESGLPFYLARLEWAGVQVHREVRTVRRRVDQGIRRVAQAAAHSRRSQANSPGHDAEWYTADLTVRATLTNEGLEVFEFWRIVAERNDLDQIDIHWTAGTGDVPLPIDDIVLDVLHGGRLVARGLAAANRAWVRVALPAVLDRGQAHDLALRVRPPASWPTGSHFVHVPFQRCDRLQLAFALHSPVLDHFDVLDGVLPGDADDELAAHRPKTLGTNDTVCVEFADLRPYLACTTTDPLVRVRSMTILTTSAASSIRSGGLARDVGGVEGLGPVSVNHEQRDQQRLAGILEV